MSSRSGFSDRVVSLALRRSGGLCEAGLSGCAGLAQDLQHRRARGAGGTRRADANEVSNAFCMCRPCHNEAESRSAVSAENGWWLPQMTGGVPTDPKSVPVLWFGSFVLFDDEGGTSPCG